MVRIIKPGTRKTAECANCGCIFSYDKEDAKQRTTGLTLDDKYVTCPQCKSDIDLVIFRESEDL